ncbi:MAG TPA: hypothetical protein PLQ97_09200 [Myxococcota bacterium]|nr:hypothetical protein [Myxococcota bacterium]HQK50954.1 hypothetical protein [Myxococcota bacterium]
MFRKSLTILVGHFGSGKTEVAVNAAMGMARDGERVALADLDVVKPYFRSREAADALARVGVDLVAPEGDLATADLPILLPRVRGLCTGFSGRVVMDVGGDENGARILGALSDLLQMADHDLILVVNFRRPFTPDPESAVAMAREIEQVSRLRMTGVFSNTHLMDRTTREVVEEGLQMARRTAGMLGVPVVGVGVEAGREQDLAPDNPGCGVLSLRRVVQPPIEGPRVPRSGPLFVLR